MATGTLVSAIGYRPEGLGEMGLDWSRYRLQIMRRAAPDADWAYSETRDFPDKPSALAYCRAIGAAFTC